MPCAKCEKKLASLATPNVHEGHKRLVGVNKLMEKKKVKDRLFPDGAKCKTCSAPLHVNGKYCPSCAHRQGLCHLCGKQIFDTSQHCMSQV